ncbi:MAG: hypothetical protein WCA19_12495 [Candidatus Acidiferrales bacterium]
MATVLGSPRGFTTLFALLVVCLLTASPAHGQIDLQHLPECSLSKTNGTCKLVIDRGNPVAPSAVQMYSNQALLVIIKNPLPFERYFLDFTTGQAALSPDVTSSIVQGLFPNLQKMMMMMKSLPGAAAAPPPKACDDSNLSTVTGWPVAKGVATAMPVFAACFGELATEAVKAYKYLEPLVAPDSLTPSAPATEPDYYRSQRKAILDEIQKYVNSESIISTKITNMSKDTKTAYTADDDNWITQLSDAQKITDAISSDLLGYNQRITDLGPCNYGSDAKKVEDCKPIAEVLITSKQDDEHVYKNMVTRTITYSLDSLNLVSYSQEAVPNPTNKKALATVALNFADAPNKFLGLPFTALRWEASAGVFFSMMPNRTFSVQPTYTIGANGPTITDNTIKESAPRPTPLPFVAANYRLTGDLPGRWKSNIYWTAAIGINPNSTVAEYATGFSYSWRALMLSALCHFGHDAYLTQGFKTTTDLGVGFTGTIPTKTYWTEAFAFGVSVRLPSLTGR